MAETDAVSPSRKQANRLAESPELQALYKRVGNRIREVRELKGVSQGVASQEVFGESTLQGNWSRWERGLTLPTIATLHQIATWGNVSLGELGLYESKEVGSAELARTRELLQQALALLEGR